MMDNAYTQYSQRPTLKKEVYTYTLENDAVALSTDRGRNERIEHKNIKSINVSFMGNSIYRCCIVSVTGEKFKISSHTLVSVGNAESQMDRFLPFVIELHDQLKGQSDTIAFTQGHPVTYYGILTCAAVFLLFVIIIIPAVLIMGKDIPAEAVIYIIFGLAVVVVGGYFFARKFKPKAYDPAKGEYPYNIDKAVKAIDRLNRKKKDISGH